MKERDSTFCDDEARQFSLRKSSEETRRYGTPLVSYYYTDLCLIGRHRRGTGHHNVSVGGKMQVK